MYIHPNVDVEIITFSLKHSKSYLLNYWLKMTTGLYDMDGVLLSNNKCLNLRVENDKDWFLYQLLSADVVLDRYREISGKPATYLHMS